MSVIVTETPNQIININSYSPVSSLNMANRLSATEYNESGVLLNQSISEFQPFSLSFNGNNLTIGTGNLYMNGLVISITSSTTITLTSVSASANYLVSYLMFENTTNPPNQLSFEILSSITDFNSNSMIMLAQINYNGTGYSYQSSPLTNYVYTMDYLSSLII